MFSVMSRSQKVIMDQIELMVKHHPIKVSRDQLKDVLKWVQEQFPNEDPKNLFNPFLCDALNLRFYNTAMLGSPAATRLLSACREVYEVVT